MKIEGNQKELDAMVEFHKGNRVEGLSVRRHIVGGVNSTLLQVLSHPRLCGLVGNCKLSEESPHTVVVLSEEQFFCFSDKAMTTVVITALNIEN